MKSATVLNRGNWAHFWRSDHRCVVLISGYKDHIISLEYIAEKGNLYIENFTHFKLSLMKEPRDH